MEKLFDEKEMFIKERPNKIPQDLEDKFYLDMAQEIIDKNYCGNDKESIASDLAELNYWHDTGFELASDLKDRSCCDYDFSIEFLEFLENIEYRKSKVLDEIVKQWVKIQQPIRKFQKGDKLVMKTDYNGIAKAGEIVYITGLHEDEARYLIHSDPERKGGYVCNYEKVEEKAELANTK